MQMVCRQHQFIFEMQACVDNTPASTNWPGFVKLNADHSNQVDLSLNTWP